MTLAPERSRPMSVVGTNTLYRDQRGISTARSSQGGVDREQSASDSCKARLAPGAVRWRAPNTGRASSPSALLPFLCMCARFQTPAQAAAERYWKLVDAHWKFVQSWRVLPTDPVPVVLTADGQRTGRMMRWGLVPFVGESKFPLINATVEKLETYYAWKAPWERRQRCILAMAGFYEPHLFPDRRKEPYYIHLADRPMFGVAGLWDRKKREDGTELLSCTLITTPPNELLAEIHNEKQRMPAVLQEADHEAWLAGTPEEAKAALKPHPSDTMVAWQVSRRLYSLKNPNDETLLARIQA